MAQRTCLICDIEVPARRRYCDACNRERARQRAVRFRAEHPEYRSSGPNVHTPRSAIKICTCQYCGDLFVARRAKGATTCRKLTCRRAFNAERMRRGQWMRSVHHVRRARRRGSRAERFNPREIFERDRWRCGVCHRRVNPDLAWPHPKSASLGHVIPIAQGGEHTRANTRCEHLVCNQRRGIGGGGEQLRLLG